VLISPEFELFQGFQRGRQRANSPEVPWAGLAAAGAPIFNRNGFARSRWRLVMPQ